MWQRLLGAARTALRAGPVLRRHYSAKDNFFSGGSATYIEEMYNSWRQDPASVHRSWQVIFERGGEGYISPYGMSAGSVPGAAASGAVSAQVRSRESKERVARRPASFPSLSSRLFLLSFFFFSFFFSLSSFFVRTTQSVIDALKVNQLIRGYQVSGHNISNLDPLGIFHADLDGSIPPEITLEHYGFSDADLSRTFYLNDSQARAFGGHTEVRCRSNMGYCCYR